MEVYGENNIIDYPIWSYKSMCLMNTSCLSIIHTHIWIRVGYSLQRGKWSIFLKIHLSSPCLVLCERLLTGEQWNTAVKSRERRKCQLQTVIVWPVDKRVNAVMHVSHVQSLELNLSVMLKANNAITGCKVTRSTNKQSLIKKKTPLTTEGDTF